MLFFLLVTFTQLTSLAQGRGCCYSNAIFADINGRGLDNGFQTQSLQQCERLCCDDSRCQTVQYSESTTDCFLHDTKDVEEGLVGDYFLYFQNICERCCYTSGLSLDIPGVGYIQYETADKSACESLCCSDPNCIAFQYSETAPLGNMMKCVLHDSQKVQPKEVLPFQDYLLYLPKACNDACFSLPLPIDIPGIGFQALQAGGIANCETECIENEACLAIQYSPSCALGCSIDCLLHNTQTAPNSIGSPIVQDYHTQFVGTCDTCCESGPIPQDIPGTGFMGMFVNSKDECSSACCTSPTCRAYQYAASETLGPDIKCLLHANQNAVGEPVDGYETYFVGASQCDECCQSDPLTTIDIPGVGFLSFEAPTIDICFDACCTNPNCLAIQYSAECALGCHMNCILHDTLNLQEGGAEGYSVVLKDQCIVDPCCQTQPANVVVQGDAYMLREATSIGDCFDYCCADRTCKAVEFSAGCSAGCHQNCRLYNNQNIASGADGDYQVVLKNRCQTAVNDRCRTATTLSVPSSVIGSTTSATVESSSTCGIHISGPGVWYDVAGTGSTIVASTCSGITNFDTVISVHSDNCVSQLCLAGNDDSSVCPNGQSWVSWESQVGVVYKVLVHGFGDNMGVFELQIGGLQANDLCETATPITSTPSSIESSTVFASLDPQSSCLELVDTAPGLWYSLQGDGRDYKVTTCLDSSADLKDTQLAVFKGTNCEDLSCFFSWDDDDDACEINEEFSTLEFFADVGETYYIYINGFKYIGKFAMEITSTPGQCGTCLFPHEYPGCDIEAVQTCLCVGVPDAFCCDEGGGNWDITCAKTALQECTQACDGDDELAEPHSPCNVLWTCDECLAQSDIGCTWQPGIQEGDGPPCTESCAIPDHSCFESIEQCSACGNCFEPRLEQQCNIPEINTCVCLNENNIFCCDDYPGGTWDNGCVNSAFICREFCDNDTDPPTGPPVPTPPPPPTEPPTKCDFQEAVPNDIPGFGYSYMEANLQECQEACCDSNICKGVQYSESQAFGEIFQCILHNMNRVIPTTVTGYLTYLLNERSNDVAPIAGAKNIGIQSSAGGTIPDAAGETSSSARSSHAESVTSYQSQQIGSASLPAAAADLNSEATLPFS